MPRLKCRFCDNRVVVRPHYIKDKTYYCRCYLCAKSLPPTEWRCEGKVKTNGIGRVKGERCKEWINRLGNNFCYNHKRQVKE